MLHKRHNSVITLAILLTFVGVSKPAKAFLLAQSETAPATFSLPDELPQNAEVQIAASNSTSSINESLKESFSSKYPEAQVNIQAQDSSSALKSLSEGKADLVSIGRALTPEEKAQGFVEVPISREKIAIVVSQNNAYDGNLTIEQFAQIFRGEITDWSELGGTPGQIQLVDLPDSNDTRQAFPSYPVFQSAEFSTGSNTVKLEEDSTDAMIAQLGESGVGYAVANDVIDREDVKIVTMHQTQPSDPKYPFSQPFSLVYQGEPSEAAQAYLGFATTEGSQQVVAERVGSEAVATGATAIAPGLAESSTDDNADISTAPQAGTDADIETPEEDVVADAEAEGEAAEEEIIADAEAEGEAAEEDVVADAEAEGETAEEEIIADADANINGGAKVEGSGEINPEVEGSGEINPEVEGSGEINPDVEGSGEINPDVEGSGEINSDFEDSGEINPDLEDSGKPLSSDNPEIDGTTTPNATPDAAIADGEATNPNTTEGETSGEETTAKKGGWWWWLLPILGIPLLGAIFAFGGRKKSDQEPAISNIPNPDLPNGGIGVSGGADGGDVSAVGANVSGNLGNVAGNAVGNSSKLGNAAIATGGAALAGGAAAAANFVGDTKRAESNTDIDIDLDEPESVTEIPSNPVSEFTGQETKLQTNVEDDLNEISAGFTNDVETSREEGSTAGIELDTDVSELETNQTTDLVDRSIDDVTNSADGIELKEVSEANITSEFSGDFVLEEETKSTLSSEQDTAINAPDVTSDINLDLNTTTEGISGTVRDGVAGIETPEVDLPNVNLDSDSDLNIVDRTTEAGGAAIAGGAAALGGAAAAASGFFNRDQDTEQPVDAEFTSEQDTAIDAPDVTSDINLDLSGTTEGIAGTVTDGVAGIETPEVDLPNVNPDSDSDLNIVDRTTEAGGAAIAGGAAALGGAAAAASGFFNRDQDTEQPVDAEFTSEQDTAIDAPEITTDIIDINLDLSETTEGISGTVSDGVAGIETPEVDLPDVNLDSDPDLNIVDRTTEAGGAAIAGGAAALGGAAAAASGFFNRNQDTEQPVDAEFTSEATSMDVDNSLEGMTLEDAANMPDVSLDDIELDDADTSINATLESITLDDAVNSSEVSLDDITFDDVETKSTSNLNDELDVNATLDDLGFEESESADSLSDDPLSNKTAEITNISDDQSNDMNNISEWLDSLETPKQSTDNISEWLNMISVDNQVDSMHKKGDQDTTTNFAEEADDINFKFLEDLLDRDPNPKQDN